MKTILTILALALTAQAQTSINGSRTVQGALNYCEDAGSSGAYACNHAPSLTAYNTGTQYCFKANTANPGAASLNLDSLGAKTIVKVQGGITTALAANDILAGQRICVIYDGTNMQITSQL